MGIVLFMIFFIHLLPAADEHLRFINEAERAFSAHPAFMEEVRRISGIDHNNIYAALTLKIREGLLKKVNIKILQQITIDSLQMYNELFSKDSSSFPLYRDLQSDLRTGTYIVDLAVNRISNQEIKNSVQLAVTGKLKHTDLYMAWNALLVSLSYDIPVQQAISLLRDFLNRPGKLPMSAHLDFYYAHAAVLQIPQETALKFLLETTAGLTKKQMITILEDYK